MPRGVNDIGEKDCGKDAVRFERFLCDVYEFSNFSEHSPAFLKPNKMILARQFHHLGIRYRLSHVTGVFHRTANVIHSMNNQRRSLYAGEHGRNVYFTVHLTQFDDGRRTGRKALEACPPIAKFRIASQTGREIR
ncbi:hypothetical protein UP10_41645 [Bradyrhizobium sp. LTSPM299]|nr:hypothetical protein UP10_41645 [Bradyrhizobium sp. LTSPM299]